MARRLHVVRPTASVTWHCACQRCACIVTVPTNGAVCTNCSMGNHHNMINK